MAKSPETKRAPKRRRRRPERARSNAGRVVGALIAVGTVVGVGTGLTTPVAEAPGQTCGGTERWNVKVANDPDSKAIDLNPTGPFKVADLNKIRPGPIGAGGRMAAEKKEYTVRGFLSYFKAEDDGDYHVVITDTPGDFTRGKTPPNGRSMIVEFPDADCFRGKSGKGPGTSVLAQFQAEARVTFEDHIKGISGAKIVKAIPVTVTGVGFFDRDHEQTGRATPHAQPDGRGVVFELHPVTEITFDNETEPD